MGWEFCRKERRERKKEDLTANHAKYANKAGP
jgi:hypothetical protein